jgi:hypothetical protein
VVTTSTPAASHSEVPARRTILAPLPDETPTPPPPQPTAEARPARMPGTRSSRRARLPAADKPRREPGGRGPNGEKPDSSTKAYLWRQNVRFIDTLVMNMEDQGARPGDINRSVVLRAAITALESAGMGRELARCANEAELAALIAARLGTSAG